MKLRILSSAFDDLAAGRMFYEAQGEGLAITSSIPCSQILILWPSTVGFTQYRWDSTAC
jgi:hypothetical protein